MATTKAAATLKNYHALKNNYHVVKKIITP